jgi:hypothetical protein
LRYLKSTTLWKVNFSKAVLWWKIKAFSFSTLNDTDNDGNNHRAETVTPQPGASVPSWN